MKRVLLFASTTGYQVRMFGEAAERLGVEIVFATDRCHQLEDPWYDRAIAVTFHDEEASLGAVLDETARRPVDGVLAVGDRPAVLAARAAEALGVPWHAPRGVRAAGNKLLTRERMTAAGLPVPAFAGWSVHANGDEVAARSPYPCVVKPLALAGSRGVIRADDPAECAAAFDRVRRLLLEKEIRALRDAADACVIVEAYVDGDEIAVEALLEAGVLRPLAVFDKPDALSGPFFEETIYITPSRRAPNEQARILAAVARAADAIGLSHGPIHAECRVNAQGVWVLEVAARPIGGLCARALRFQVRLKPDAGTPMAYEELLLRHALGEPLLGVAREPLASGVMMIPIPRAGILRRVEGADDARAVAGIDDVRMTAKPDQLLVPLPEGSSYLGFIFARGNAPEGVVRSLREAHARLRFTIETPIAVV